jgi:penicillin amidase
MEVMPHVLTDSSVLSSGSGEMKRAVEYLRNWDFVFSEDDIATAIFQQMFVRLLHNIYADEMGEELLHDFVILGNIPIRVTHRLLEEGKSPWFDNISTSVVETKSDIIRNSLGEALDSLRSRFGHDTRNWRWGEMHTLTISHPFGLVKPLDRIFNIGPFPMGGGPTTVMSAEYDFNNPFGVTVASSFRMVYDFGKPDEVQTILPSGQSGQVFSSHYDDQTASWLNGTCKIFRSDSLSMVSSRWLRLVLKASP